MSKQVLQLIDHPHRKLLIERILSYSPIESILEIGCNSGPNLYLLSRQLHEAKLYEIDINTFAIEEGEEHFKENNFPNVFLSPGKAHELESFCDKSVDVVFTDAVIMYIGPDKIETVMSEVFRVARKAVIFNEWHIWKTSLINDFSDTLETKNYYHYGHWVYDYKCLLGRYASPENIKVTRIPKGLWPDAGWEKYGSVIEVEGLTR